MDIQIKNLVSVMKTEGHEYYSLPSMVNMSGLSLDSLKPHLEHSVEIRKSIITDENNNPLYTLNTPFSGVRDAWNAFRYLNHLKTE